MIQPAGYIRIMAEELVKNNRSVFGKVVTGVEHVAVGLPFVHLLQPPPGNPDERIKPKETADQLDGNAFRRMAVTDMTRFMAENDHAPATFVSSAQKNRAQERKGSGDLRMLGKGVRPAIGQTRPSPQTANSDHADRKKPKRQKHRRQIAPHSHRAQYAPPAGCDDRTGSGELPGRLHEVFGRGCGDQRQRIDHRPGRVERNVERRDDRREKYGSDQIAAAGPE